MVAFEHFIGVHSSMNDMNGVPKTRLINRLRNLHTRRVFVSIVLPEVLVGREVLIVAQAPLHNLGRRGELQGQGGGSWSGHQVGVGSQGQPVYNIISPDYPDGDGVGDDCDVH